MNAKMDYQSSEVVKQIIRASVELITTKGFYGTKLSDIASKVGISKPALYWHFKNKDDLFFKVIDFVREEYMKDLTAFINSDLLPYEKLCKAFDFSYIQNKYDLNLHVFLMKMMLEFLNKNEEYEEILRTIYMEYINAVKTILDEGVSLGLFKRDVNTDNFSMCLVGTMDGIVQQCLLHSKNKIHLEYESQIFFLKIIESILC